MFSKRFLFTLLMLGLMTGPRYAFAQLYDVRVPANPQIAPSPQASSATRFAAYPVNLSNGTVGISIPLAGLPGLSTSLPVTLNYRTSGNRVSDVSGPAGLGWSLQSGGLLTRIVRGRPDDEYSYYWPTPTQQLVEHNGYSGPYYSVKGRGPLVHQFIDDPGYIPAKEAVRKWANGDWDAQPDLYVFVLPNGQSGRFVLDQNGIPLLIPHQNSKVHHLISLHLQEYGNRTLNQRYSTWVITTADGTSYLFGNPDPVHPKGYPATSDHDPDRKAIERTQQTITRPFFYGPCFPRETETLEAFASSWYLTEIISPQGHTEMRFSYLPGKALSYDHLTQVQYELLYPNADEEKQMTECGLRMARVYRDKIIPVKTTTTILNPLYVQSVESAQGKLTFFYDENRTDLPNAKRLIGVQLTNKQDEVIHTVNLQYEAFPNQAPLLKRVVTDQQPPYEFSYNRQVNLPARNAFDVDRWGYYNGAGNQHGIPGYVFRGFVQQGAKCQDAFCSGTGANVAPSEVHTQANILTGIQFPGGGRVDYTYQPHEYYNGQANVPWGGLRIHTVTSYDARQPDQKKVVTYGYVNHTPAPEAKPMTTADGKRLPQSSGTIDPTFIYPVTADQFASNREGDYFRIFREIEFKDGTEKNKLSAFLVRSSQPANGWNLIAGDPLVYRCVQVSEAGMGKTMHRFTSFADHPEAPAKRFWITLGGQRMDKDLEGRVSMLPYLVNSSRSWERGLPTQEEVYGEQGQLKSWKQYAYNFTPERPNRKVYGLVVQDQGTGTYDPGALADVLYGYYTEEPGWAHLERVTERVYGQAGTGYVETQMVYTYNPRNLQVASQTFMGAEGKQVQVRYRYPVDYPLVNQYSDPAFTGTPDLNDPAQTRYDYRAVVNEMVRRHMIAYVIEQQVWQQEPGVAGFKLHSASLTDYRYVPKPEGYRHWLFTRIWSPRLYPDKTTLILPYQTHQLYTLTPLSAYTASNLDSQGQFTFDGQRFRLENTMDQYTPQGRAVAVRGSDQVQQVKLWSAGGLYPIASVSNARPEEVAYTSFEGYGDPGQWQYSSQQCVPGEAQTGSQYFTGGTVTSRANLPSQPYRVCFWYRGSGLALNGTPLAATSQWTYYEQRLLSPGQVTLQVAATARLDELRLHPVQAKMATSVFLPLRGVQATSDLNNRITYYEYDPSHRWVVIRDQYRRIIGQRQFHLAGQAP